VIQNESKRDHCSRLRRVRLRNTTARDVTVHDIRLSFVLLAAANNLSRQGREAVWLVAEVRTYK
jgi:hypothetical protein